MNKQRKMNAFAWIPPSPRTDLYSRPLPNQKIDPRTPVYWMSKDGDDLYFINESDQTLTAVIGSSGGMITTDEDVLGIYSNDLVYLDVRPKEAVKVASYDPIDDSDYYLCADVVLKQADGSLLHYQTDAERGGPAGAELRWNTGETGKKVRRFEVDAEKQKQAEDQLVNEKLRAIHRHCYSNREEITRSEKCGCLHCMTMFSPAEITEWWDSPTDPNNDDDGTTAVCPRCGIDSVIGSASNFELTTESLKMMNDWAF